MEYIYMAFAVIILMGLSTMVWFVIEPFLLFKYGPNPYNRVCKKCGAGQTAYSWSWDNTEMDMWWEETTAKGDNPKCRCHKHSEYRSNL